MGELAAAFERTGSGLRLHVLAQPRASRDGLVGVHDGQLKIAIRAPPVEGEANEAIRAFLAKLLGVPKKSVALTQGDGSRRKVVVVVGDPAALEATLRAKLGA